MESFEVNMKFDNFDGVLRAKKNYEQASNTVLVITGSHKLKGEGAFVKSNVYDRLTFECKAGSERPFKGKGIRSTSTYKMGCPFKVNISLLKSKLTVTHLNTHHENHQTDRNTFLSYPENVKLTEKEKDLVKPMITCGANKQKVKAFLMKDREAPVLMKSLYNLQTKEQQKKQTPNRKDDLKRLIEMMIQTPNARVRIIKNENDDLIGVLFQDERMAHFYDKFPEIIFFDATHKLNNTDMPLFIQLCVDGNGETEIISLYVCVSESREGIGSMLDEFKNLNPAYTKTKVILGDKDFADRSVYLEKFLNAVMKICIFHVLRTFRREITSHKRGITNEQRNKALSVLQSLVYCTSEVEYNYFYDKLTNLNLENVKQYYDDNWHLISDEWTLFGINQHCSYLNATNNCLESLNQKLKLVGNRNANLQTFFENLSISVSNKSSEKDAAALRGTMRKSRQCYEDPVLTSYTNFLTTFSFKKIEIQYELAAQVKFSSIDESKAVVSNKNNDKVTTTRCSCMFFSSMELPCRHILKFLITNNMNSFAPQLCAIRWTKQYYNSAHPALSSHIQINSTQPVYAQVRDSNRIDQYKKNDVITKEIRNISINLPPQDQNYYLNKLKELRNEMKNSSTSRIVVSEECVQREENPAVEVPLDLSVNHQSTPASDINCEESRINYIDHQCNKENLPDSLQQNSEREIPIFKQSQQLLILSSIDNIKVPNKVMSVGRPKGRTNTAIGIKRKRNSAISKTAKKVNEDTTGIINEPEKFVDKTRNQQAFDIIKWLTLNQYSGHKKIIFQDIVNDMNVFQRLRNDQVDLCALEQFMESKAFDYIKNEVAKMQKQCWICSKCNSNLDGYQVQCDVCLDWFHFKCVQDPFSKRYFICTSCY